MAGVSRTVKVGIFVVGGVVLFCVGLFLVGSRANLFGNRYTIYADFNNIDTLQKGAKVRVGGMDAGELTGIQIPSSPSAKFRLKLEVEKKFQPIIRHDSTATLETEGMVGNVYVNIKKGGANSPVCRPGCVLPSQETVSMGQVMQEGSALAGSIQSTINDLHHRADGVMQNLTSATGHADQMIQKVQPNVVHLTSNANAIVAGIRQGHGTVGKLLTDKTMAANVSQTIANVKDTSANAKKASGKVNTMMAQVEQKDLPKVHQTVANADAATQKINKAVGQLLSPGKNKKSTAVEIRETLDQADRTTANLADDTEAVKHNFFLRGFFHRRGFYSFNTMTPTKYAASRFVKKPAARVWVPAAGVFSIGPDNAQALTNAGKAILDHAMSGLTPYLPNNPVVVEGYSTSGPPSQQYLASRQRAILVSEYLQKHFHLNPKWVGVMPFSAHPPTGAGKTIWNGVCLVLVVSKKQ